MNCILAASLFGLFATLTHSLVIDELPSAGYELSTEAISHPDRDFLNVNVEHDLLDTSAEIVHTHVRPEGSSQGFNFVNRDGSPVECFITLASKPRIVDREQNVEAMKLLLLALPKTCYYLKSGHWIYEYCHLKLARQVSKDKASNGHYEDYALGRFYPPRHGLQLVSELGYVKTVFVDGAFCALRGGPRTSQIRFMCASPKKEMYIVDVVEKTVCEYIFLVHVPVLCAYLPMDSIFAASTSTITCYSPTRKGAVSPPVEPSLTQPASDASDNPIESLERLITLIESKYNNSKLLVKHRKTLRRAAEKLKSHKVGEKLAEDSSLADLISNILRQARGADDDEEPHEVSKDTE